MIANNTPQRATVRKAAGKWHTACPCAITWMSRFHRLALLMATTHGHLAAVA